MINQEVERGDEPIIYRVIYLRYFFYSLIFACVFQVVFIYACENEASEMITLFHRPVLCQQCFKAG